MANGNGNIIGHVEDGCNSCLSLLKKTVANVVQHVQGQTTQESDDWMKKPEFEEYARQLCSTLEKDIKTIPEKLGLLTYSPEQLQQKDDDKKCKHTKPLEEESEPFNKELNEKDQLPCSIKNENDIEELKEYKGQQIDGLNQELCKVKTDNKGLETRIKSLEEDNERLKKENEGLKKKKGKPSKGPFAVTGLQ